MHEKTRDSPISGTTIRQLSRSGIEDFNITRSWCSLWTKSSEWWREDAYVYSPFIDIFSTYKTKSKSLIRWSNAEFDINFPQWRFYWKDLGITLIVSSALTTFLRFRAATKGFGFKLFKIMVYSYGRLRTQHRLGEINFIWRKLNITLFLTNDRITFW